MPLSGRDRQCQHRHRPAPVDVLMGAFHQAVPDKVCAACSGEMNLLNIGGFKPITGEYYNYVETYAGGQGASVDLDGADGVHTHLTNTAMRPSK